MNKAFVDHMIHNLKLADMVTKTTPWMVEGFGEKQMNVRYVGIHIKDDWLEIFSEKDNLLTKFIVDKKTAYIEFYLANKPPFIKIISKIFSDSDKWEILFGELKRTLKKDKAELVHHTDNFGNLYSLIKPHLR